MYISIEEYLNLTSTESPLSQKEAKKLLETAEIKIDEVTFGRIKGIGFDRLTDFQQCAVKRAMVLQADYVYDNGADETNIKSYSILDINVTVGDDTSSAGIQHISPVAAALLKNAGLCDRRC